MAESTADIIEYTSGKFKFLIDTDTGFFNATNMCKQQRKQYGCYTKLVRCNSIELLMPYYGDNYKSYCPTTAKLGQEAAGTYCHPIIFLSVAMWCSSEVYVTAAKTVKDFFNSNQARRDQFKRLLAIKNRSHIDVEFDLAIDNNCWLGVVSLVQTGKKIKKFNDLENRHDVTEVKYYMKKLCNLSISSSLSSNGTKYYPPIIFLRMAALISDEFYVKVSRIVLASLSGNRALSEQILSARSEVDSKSIALPAPITLDRRVDVQPHIDATDVDVTDNDVAEQHQKTIELQPTHSKTVPGNTSIDEMEMLRLQIEKLRFDKRVDRILNLFDRQGVNKVESIIVILRSEGDIYTFRRQVESIPEVLYEHKVKFEDFMCWFLTDNAVQDYNDIRKTLCDVLQVPITFEYNIIKMMKNSREIVARKLYDRLKSMDTIEADVTVLRQLYDDRMPSHRVHNYKDKRIHQLLDQVYKYVTIGYNDVVEKNRRNTSN